MIFNSCEACLLSVGKILSPASITVTSTPKSIINDANSIPITPPPIIPILDGNVFNDNISSLDKILS